MFAYELQSLEKVTGELKRLLGNKLVLIEAFGSRVRGDFTGDSDFDVLVVIDKPDLKDKETVIKVFSAEEELVGVPYSPVIKSLRSLLVLKGIDASAHAGCKTMLSMHFVRQGLMSKGSLDIFKSLLSRRTDVDYGDFEEIDGAQAEDSVGKAREFVGEAMSVRTSLASEKLP